MSNLENQAGSSPMAVADPPHNLLSRIEIENFRGFRRLTLDGLQRVNLIVGKNNSGKTSLLEAVLAICQPRHAPPQFRELRPIERDLAASFSGDHYSSWVVSDGTPDGSARLRGMVGSSVRFCDLTPAANSPHTVTAQPIDQKRTGSKSGISSIASPLRIATSVVPTTQRSSEMLVNALGNTIRRQGGEEMIEQILSSVDPRIRKIRVVPVQNQTQVVVDVGLSRLLPLSQVGQGTYRLVEIFSEIIGSDAKVAVIDEIENGIHHSCLIDLWRGIAAAATQFDVQIFATTHSQDCIEAAHRACCEQPAYQLSVIQLFRDSVREQGRVLDERLIDAAIAGDFEMRS